MKKILVIDDEPLFRQTLSDFLTHCGYDVFAAGDGEEALGVLNRIEPDLILLDIQMPRMSGISFYTHISTSEGKSRYPVIVLTARENLEDLFTDLKVEAFVPKPVKLEQLLIEIQRVICSKEFPIHFEKSSAKSKKILVVDNDEAKFRQIAGELAACGFLVCGAKSGSEALAKAAQEVPDLVLTKLGLPDIFGDILALQLKNFLPETSKVMVYTAFDEKLDGYLARKICNTSSVSKLIEFSNAHEIVKEILESL